MTRTGPHVAGRREFLRGLVRWPLLAAAGALAAYLGTRRAPLQAGETCVNRGVCRGCDRLAACALPQATMSRPVLEQGRR